MDGVAARRKWTPISTHVAETWLPVGTAFESRRASAALVRPRFICWSSPSVAASVWPAENGPPQRQSPQPRSPVSVPVRGVGADSSEQGFDGRIADVAVGGMISAGAITCGVLDAASITLTALVSIDCAPHGCGNPGRPLGRMSSPPVTRTLPCPLAHPVTSSATGAASSGRTGVRTARACAPNHRPPARAKPSRILACGSRPMSSG